MPSAGQEVGDGDRQGLDIALVDVDLDERAGRQRRCDRERAGKRRSHHQSSSGNSSSTQPLDVGSPRRGQNISLGSKLTTTSAQISCFSCGNPEAVAVALQHGAHARFRRTAGSPLDVPTSGDAFQLAAGVELEPDRDLEMSRRPARRQERSSTARSGRAAHPSRSATASGRSSSSRRRAKPRRSSAWRRRRTPSPC